MTNKEYWEQRQQDTFAKEEENALELAKQLKKNYEKAIREINKEIIAFYGKYARENGLTIQEVQQLLNPKELKSFKEQLDEYIDYAQDVFGNTYLKKLQQLKAQLRITRLDELKANIEHEIVKLTQDNFELMEESLQDIYENTYYHTLYNADKLLKQSISFTKPNTRAVERYLGQDLNIANYSIGETGVWKKIDQLTNLLNTRIPQGLILGYNPKKVAKIAEKTMDTDYNSAVRLVRTEYNYIFNQATKDSYEQCGVQQYQILATLDERTCNSCGPLDLLVVDYDAIVVGLNYPPFHPNCRCTTIPYFEKDEFDVPIQRIAKDKNGKPYMVPEDLTYNEWKAGLTTHTGGVTYWKPDKNV